MSNQFERPKPEIHPARSGEFDGLREAALDSTYVSLGNRRTSSVHEFYRYPARFPPAFAEAVIRAFSIPGDVVLDPYVGGGTTAVAAQELGRRVVASDINPLATFVTSVKTDVLNKGEIADLQKWGEELTQLRLSDPVQIPTKWIRAGYLRNLNSPEVWRIRDSIALALSRVSRLRTGRAQEFARCAILRTGQWALDMRSSAPSVSDFREALHSNLHGMLAVMSARASASLSPVRVKTSGLPGIQASGLLDGWTRPQLVLTSPPYPGVYVLYHRWKVLGRKESPAPYWITSQLDGHGMTRYTMGNHKEEGLTTYFDAIHDGFAELVEIADPNAWFVQVVGFKNVERDLPRYLDVLSAAGLSEVLIPNLSTSDDGRLWRSVPNRRWWTQNEKGQRQSAHTSNELVMFHRVS